MNLIRRIAWRIRLHLHGPRLYRAALDADRTLSAIVEHRAKTTTTFVGDHPYLPCLRRLDAALGIIGEPPK